MSDDEESVGSQKPEDQQEEAVPSKDVFADGDDDEAEMEEMRRRRERVMAAQKAKFGDKVGDDGDPPVTKIVDLFADDPIFEKPQPTRQTPQRGASGPTGSADGEDTPVVHAPAPPPRPVKEDYSIKVGNKTLTPWPYDNYHMQQIHFWQLQLERERRQKEEEERLAAEEAADAAAAELSGSDSSDDDEDEGDKVDSNDDASKSGSSSSSGDEDDDKSKSSSSSSASKASKESEDHSDEDSTAREKRKRRERKLKKKRKKKRKARRRKKKQEQKEKELAQHDEKETAEEKAEKERLRQELEKKYRKTIQEEKERERDKGEKDLASDMMVFARPADPPDIPQAVIGLPLSEFESVAKERAISIVSTWLFDAGLIDELMTFTDGGRAAKKAALAAHLAGIHPEGSGPTQPEDKTKPKDKRGKKPSIKEDKSKPKKKGEKDKAELDLEEIMRPTKMDVEVEKLRTATEKQLEIINIRLNDGVTASGNEVQDLVNNVSSFKAELVRLREVSSTISHPTTGAPGRRGGAAQANPQSGFAINKYPHLKYAINARRNLAKCFRELTFFSQIPETCDKLREDLNSCEWTEHEWTTLRNVCREHVNLEIFLVEAEAGMKKAADDDDEDDRKRRSSTRGGGFLDGGLPHNTDEVDRFLKEHVQNVWELGDEIRMRILSGIAGAFDLALNNPAGMVALVEAVEAYEIANREYKAVHGVEAGGVAQSLRFTDMRAVALGELYKDMEARGIELFEELTLQVEQKMGEGEDMTNELFTAILRGANELSSEIGFVADQMAPCFPPYWAIETIWTTCVAHLCSSQILAQIGGSEGENLPILSTVQLLDLVAWVENFREIIEESFPDIASVDSKRTYFDERPNLLIENNKVVDVGAAKDSLAWVNNILWDTHDLAKKEFIFRTKEQTNEWLTKVYNAEHEKSQTTDGLLITSLCEDVYALAGVQMKTIRERLPRKSEAMVSAVSQILKTLYVKQKSSRDQFLVDFETCCAGANDFVRMSEKLEEILFEIRMECTLTEDAEKTLDEQSGALLSQYSTDAVYAAQKTVIYIFQAIHDEIGEELFSVPWLDEYTDNDLGRTIYVTMEDFLGDLNGFLDSIMVQKVLEALIGRTISYYVEQLLDRSSKHKKGNQSFFADNKRALDRMNGDLRLCKEFFEGLAEEDFPTLSRVIDQEFEFFETIHEILSIASGNSDGDIQDFVFVFCRRLQNFEMTKLIVGDLYHLVNPGEEKNIYEVVDGLEEELKSYEEEDKDSSRERIQVPGVRLDQVFASHIEKSERKRPIKGEGGGGIFGGGGLFGKSK